MEPTDPDLDREIAEITEQTRDISWDDISSILHFDPSLAQQQSKLLLVGRLVSRKIHPRQVILPVIRMRWRCLKGFQIEDAGPNKFLFTFSSVEDKNRILLQEPWNFKGSLMILCEWPPSVAVEDIDLTMVSFWARFIGFHWAGWRVKMFSYSVVKLGKFCLWMMIPLTRAILG